MNTRPNYQTVNALLFLLLAASLPHIILLPLGFFFDDSLLLDIIQGKHFLDFVISSEVTQQIKNMSFTPLLYLSYFLDYKMWGTNGWGFSIHNFVAYYFFGVSLFFFFRCRKISTLYATLFAIVVLYIPSVVSISAWASTRHYLEGMVWAVLSLIMASKWLSDKKKHYFWLTLLFYFFAILSKEIFLPLIAPAILLVVFSSFQKSMRLGLGFGVIVILYFYYRFNMLGSVVDERWEIPPPQEILFYLILSWPRFAAFSVDMNFFGLKAISSTIITHCLLVFSIVAAWKVRGWLGVALYIFLLVTTIIVAAPVLSDPRYTFAYSHVLFGNRFIFPFSIMVVVLFFLLLENTGWQESSHIMLRTSRLWTSLVLIVFFACYGFQQASEWSRLKLSNSQWQKALEVSQDGEKIFIGRGYNLADLAIVVKAKLGKTEFGDLKTLGEFTQKKLPDSIRRDQIILVMPKHPIRSATSDEELLEWLHKYHESRDYLKEFYQIIDK